MKVENLYFTVAKEGGIYVGDEFLETSIPEKFLKQIDELPLGVKMIIDFKGVKLISPLVVELLVKKIDKKRCCLVVKDPNVSVLWILRDFLKRSGLTLIAVYSDPEKGNKIKKEEILNLPDFLQTALNIIKKNGPISSRDLREKLNRAGKKGSAAREYLRRLYRAGLVDRVPVDAGEGRIHFLYTKFSLL